jgi:hypothetical protein
VARTIRFSRLLWLLTTAWIAACGRVSFDPLSQAGLFLDAGELDATGTGHLDAVTIPAPDAPGTPAPDGPGTPPADGPGTPTQDAAAPVDTAPPPAPKIEVPPTLAFAPVCGANPVDQLLTVKNIGTADLEITSATLAANDPNFQVIDVQTPIAPNQTGTITLQPRMATIGNDRSGGTFKSTLTLETNAETVLVSLEATVEGANVDNKVNGVVNITGGGATCPAAVGVQITNNGSSGVTLNQLVASGISITGFSGGTLNAGASTIINVRPTSCTGNSTTSTVINFSANSGSTLTALCAGQPITVNLQVAFNSTGGCACNGSSSS